MNLNSVLRQDPTRTTTLRNQFMADATRRFKQLEAIINQAIVDFDVFGLNTSPMKILADATPKQFAFTTTDRKITGFMDWLKGMERKGILEITTRPSMYSNEHPWTNTYVRTAYQKGIARAGQELRAAGYDIPEMEGFSPSGASGLAVAMNQPFHAERVAVIYTRTYNELKGITDAMDQQLSRVLAEGLTNGDNPMTIARNMVDRVDKIGITRARTLARTEVINAHHQATINTYEQWGVLGVSVQAEWLTAGYNVCPICSSMGGKVFSLKEIRGMIPAHPNCRCCAIPTSAK